MAEPRWDDPETAGRLLSTATTIAVVGCSPDPRRPCHDVTRYLIDSGYYIYPVNPKHTQILGLPCLPDLASVPAPIDIVDIFRRSEEAGAHVDEAIDVGAKAVWLQVGVIDEEAAARARDAGLEVIMDRCTMDDHRRFGRRS